MATALRRALTLLKAPANDVAFTARSVLRWSRGAPALADEDKGTLFDWLPPRERALLRARERGLRQRYDLQALRGRSSVLHYAENVALLDLLERLWGDRRPAGGEAPLRAVDVGCGDFRYATALQRFLARDGRPVDLCGVEVDGHGIYRDGHSRADHGRAHAALAGDGVGYAVADFTRWDGCGDGALDVVTMLFPFVSRYALLRWGLPLRLHRPHELMARAAAALRPGGLLVTFHQTAGECAAMRELVAGLPLSVVAEAGLATGLVPYHARTEGRRGLILERRAEGGGTP